ncbi:MAG TPA: agmatinase family protein [Chitinophagaceae bacterium]|jgi:agmatinase|nr:agmatinase family protein [Chitinophagaceae bacterium]OPZ15945.1 MAG: N(1)-aminopropylagmatine ureohydrolase [Bacteroidetes bacterium ADurb.BinA245]HMW65679.1 agmatinase family protein [Chitinophagaceae bacterium]HNA90934.1 agmatinase family protein [Chitinophagaceae bacterium]HNA96653.1 agmatinase family protein [Chitinophagaceae bacterium]
MLNISNYDPNSVANPNHNIFGLPTDEESARLVIVPVPWEVTVSYNAGTARAAEAVFKASFQVDLFDPEFPDTWQQGYYMRHSDKKILMKSDYLRKEAELFIDYISKGEEVSANQFMCKTLKEVNEGGVFLNNWVYEQTKELLNKNKLVALLGGDHSTPLGFFKAIGEKHGDFGILQIDAHFDLREAYEGFTYSHASIMYNALKEIPAIKKLVQAGIRDYGSDEYEEMKNSNGRIVTFFDKDMRNRQYEGASWKSIAEEIVSQLPQSVYISFDIDGLDRKYCPFTGTPVPGGFELEQVYYLFSKILASGRKLIGFDLNEVGIGGDTDWDANVGARVLYKMCNLLVASNPVT